MPEFFITRVDGLEELVEEKRVLPGARLFCKGLPSSQHLPIALLRIVPEPGGDSFGERIGLSIVYFGQFTFVVARKVDGRTDIPLGAYDYIQVRQHLLG